MIEQIIDFFRITPTDSDARRVWVVGDLHGCYDSFMKLLEKIDFDPSKDKLWLTGDLVNRGEGSLQILEYLYSIKDRVRIVLGNHDISMLAADKNIKNSNPTLDPIFRSPDREKLMNWIASMPLIHYDKKLGCMMVHAGIPPDFTLTTALKYNNMLTKRINSPKRKKWLKRLMSSKIVHFDKNSTLRERLTFAIGAFTRMRYCQDSGDLDYAYKGKPGKKSVAEGLIPWFLSPLKQTIKPTILFGHWSTLGLMQHQDAICMDTGCIWHGKLTAMRIDDKSHHIVYQNCTAKNLMDSIMGHFDNITNMPHCSRKTKELREYIIDFATNQGYDVIKDKAKNILVTKGNPSLALQAHYDMVCIGEAPSIQTYIDSGWLKAKESSLGADNGIAIAMMLNLIEEGKEIEFIFTNDEEIGLVGAKGIEIDIKSKYMLNLDFEDEGELCIGCAGGADIHAVMHSGYASSNGDTYEISIRDLPGGHSGVDIDKGIPSAIKLLAQTIKDNNIDQINTMKAGEQINSIPANAVAVVTSSFEPIVASDMQLRKIDANDKMLDKGNKLIEMIAGFTHGVVEDNLALSIPQKSLNLAKVYSDNEGNMHVDISVRAMDDDGLQQLVEQSVSYLEKFDFKCTVNDKYPAWRPEENRFTDIVKLAITEEFGSCKTVAIHAGLECGILKEQYPHIQFASIGPTIKYPHSTREMLKLDSVEPTYKAIEQIVKNVST